MSLADSPAPKLALDEIFNRHGIAPEFRPGFRALVADAVTPDADLRSRLDNVTNYRECFDEILTRLSKPFAHLFNHDES